MILPLSSINPDAGYPFANLYPYGIYGLGYGRKLAIQQEAAAAPVNEVQDIVSLSPAALRLMDQVEQVASTK